MEYGILVALFVVIILIVLFRRSHARNRCSCERFLPAQKWSDWDNYDKDYGQTRAYWGNQVSGGGWSGNPHAPDNDPSGVGFGAATPDYSRHGKRIRREKRIRHGKRTKNVNLSTATDEELADMYRMGIMANR